MHAKDYKKVKVKDYISRKDPQGYYVIPARFDAVNIAEKFRIEIENVGNCVLLRTKSRRVAETLVKLLMRKGLLDC